MHSSFEHRNLPQILCCTNRSSAQWLHFHTSLSISCPANHVSGPFASQMSMMRPFRSRARMPSLGAMQRTLQLLWNLIPDNTAAILHSLLRSLINALPRLIASPTAIVLARDNLGSVPHRHVNLSVLFDSCLTSKHDHMLRGDRLLSENHHSILSGRDRDNRFSCRFSEWKLIKIIIFADYSSSSGSGARRLKTLNTGTHCRSAS